MQIQSEYSKSETENEMANWPRVGIHICTFNRPEYVSCCLASLYGQTYRNFDITIVDDYSDPPVQNNPLFQMWFFFMRNAGFKIDVIRNPIRLGICKSRNTAVKNDTSNDVFIRLDDDSFCEKDYVERLVRTYYDQSLAGQLSGNKVGAVGGIVPYPMRPPDYRNSDTLLVFNETICNEDGTFAEMNDSEPNPRDHGYLHWIPPRIMLSHHLRSSFLFTREAFDGAGGFPEELGGNTGFREETLFCFKVLQAGLTLWTDPEAKAWHFSAQGKGRNFSGRDYKEVVQSHEASFKQSCESLCKELVEKNMLTVKK